MNISERITDISNSTSNDMESESGNFSQLVNYERSKSLDGNITDALIRSFGIALACTGMLCNFYVLKSVISVPSANLKSKFFIVNMLLTDFLLPLFASFDTIPFIIHAFGITSDYIYNCLKVSYQIPTPVIYYSQCLASLVLSCDRLYAILAPLKYYTDGYPRWLLLCIVGITWIIPLSLISPVFIIPLIRDLPIPGLGICYKLTEGHKAWTVVIRSFVLLSIGGVTFCIYIILFILVQRLRRYNIAVTETLAKDRKTSVSLIVTYFMIHCTSLALFLPSPIYSELLNLDSFQVNRSTHTKIRRTLTALFLINSIVDPIILSFRIPAIKVNLYRMLDFAQTSHQRSSSRAKSTQSQPVSTIA